MVDALEGFSLEELEFSEDLAGSQMVRYGNDNYAACCVVEFGSLKRDCPWWQRG